jgi:hypothetical protein
MRPCSRLKQLIIAPCVLLVACGQSQHPDHLEHQLQIASAQLDDSQSQQRLQLELRHRFSPTLTEALHNGVTLTYAWQLELMDADGSPWQGRRWLDQGTLNVSFRSFTRWYTLAQQPSAQNSVYPDLEHTYRALESLSVPVHIPPELMVPASPYRFRFRIYLDTNELPPPLRLPAQMNSDWQLDSGWHEWWPPPESAALAYHVDQ